MTRRKFNGAFMTGKKLPKPLPYQSKDEAIQFAAQIAIEERAMNEAKEAVCGEYAEVLHKEIAKLRDINKDLLDALRKVAEAPSRYSAWQIASKALAQAEGK